MENRCEFCQITGEPVYYKTVAAKNGETADVFVCENCYRKIDKENKWIEENIQRLKDKNLIFGE